MGVRKKVNSNTSFRNTVVCAVSLATDKEVVVAGQSRPPLCDPTDCSMSGLPVLHYLPVLAQTYVP